MSCVTEGLSEEYFIATFSASRLVKSTLELDISAECRTSNV